MNTTSVLVDILIIGIQVLTWFCLLVFSFVLKTDILDFEKTPFLIFVIIAMAYTLGVVFDYIFAPIFECFKGVDEKNTYKNVSVIKIIHKHEEIHNYLDSQYARLRIARATVINLPLITIFLCLFIWRNNFNYYIYDYAILYILLIGITLTIFSVFSWRRRNKNYIKYINEILQIIQENKE